MSSSTKTETSLKEILGTVQDTTNRGTSPSSLGEATSTKLISSKDRKNFARISSNWTIALLTRLPLKKQDTIAQDSKMNHKGSQRSPNQEQSVLKACQGFIEWERGKVLKQIAHPNYGSSGRERISNNMTQKDVKQRKTVIKTNKFESYQNLIQRQYTCLLSHNDQFTRFATRKKGGQFILKQKITRKKLSLRANNFYSSEKLDSDCIPATVLASFPMKSELQEEISNNNAIALQNRPWRSLRSSFYRKSEDCQPLAIDARLTVANEFSPFAMEMEESHRRTLSNVRRRTVKHFRRSVGLYAQQYH